MEFIDHSPETTELAKALLNVQRQMAPATKDGKNPFTKSSYATLNSVMESCREALLNNHIWLQAQVNFLYKFWSRPVFSLKNESGETIQGEQTFPQICKNHFGITLPDKPDKISVENWLLYISMKEVKAFGPYLYDRSAMKETLKIAGDFWNQLKHVKQGKIAREALEYAHGFYPLCAYCEINVDCPKFMEGSYQPDWENVINHLDHLKNKRSEIDSQIRDIETSLKQLSSGPESDRWINTGGHRFRTTNVAGRKTLDARLLHQELEKIFVAVQRDDIDVQAFLDHCAKIGEPSLRLTIMPIN